MRVRSASPLLSPIPENLRVNLSRLSPRGKARAVATIARLMLTAMDAANRLGGVRILRARHLVNETEIVLRVVHPRALLRRASRAANLVRRLSVNGR